MIRYLILLISALFALSGLAEPFSTWTDSSFVERAFKQVTLKKEFHRGLHPLSKWQSPIRYWIHHEVGDSNLQQQLVELHFDQLRELTHLSITPAETEEQANFTLYFTQQSRWSSLVAQIMGRESVKHTQGSLCLFGNALDEKEASIIRAVVIIPVDLAREHGKLMACIVEETTQALGLRNDSTFSYPSVFNDKTPEQFLSPLDVILIQLMYEPAIESGMEDAELTPVLQRLIWEYKKYNILKNAAHQANQAPLVKHYR
jgi:hypothetical protein